uniref:RRM domain-containing protein n=1 Tax=Gongylonema pulchrum TaxID=637853 RepID=A0A183DF36_9BILA
LLISWLWLINSCLQLRQYYSQWGTVVDCIVIRDPQTKYSRGFGFVTFATVQMAEAAMADRPHTINNKIIKEKYSNQHEINLSWTRTVVKRKLWRAHLICSIFGKKKSNSLTYPCFQVVDPKRAIPREQMSPLLPNHPPSFLEIEPDPGCKLSLSGIHWAWHTVDDLRQYFDSFGVVEQIEILGNPRGLGFVVFENKAAADKCLEHGKIHVINGQKCEVTASFLLISFHCIY